MLKLAGNTNPHPMLGSRRMLRRAWDSTANLMHAKDCAHPKLHMLQRSCMRLGSCVPNIAREFKAMSAPVCEREGTASLARRMHDKDRVPRDASPSAHATGSRTARHAHYLGCTPYA